MAVVIDLTGRIVLVTGGTRGVGKGITETFATAGATVVTCARSEAPEGHLAEHVVCDVRDPDAVTALVQGIIARHGRLDVVVNNAGGAPYALAADASPRFHAKVVDLNLLSPLLVSQAAYAVMREAGGSIVNISSLSAIRPSPGTAAYGAAKAGIDSLTRSLAAEWAPAVRVNSLHAGAVLTEQPELHFGGAEGVERINRTIPMGRLALPSDVANVALFLASDLAGYLTGTSIDVHGGGEIPPFLLALEDT